MCLSCAKVEFLEEDKVVYKVFKKTPDGKLYTAYQEKAYKISDNVIHDSLDFFECSDNLLFSNFIINGHEFIGGQKFKINGHEFIGGKVDVDCYNVICGMIHSFVHYEDASKVANKKDVDGDYEYVVVKGIIPKESKLVMCGRFKSIFGKFDSYASSDIIFKEIVEKCSI